jgi:hypothetical protein
MENSQCSDKPYIIQPVTGKGNSLVANTKIVKGQRLLSEAPIFRFPEPSSELEAIVAKEIEVLDSNQKATFFTLTNSSGTTSNDSKAVAIVKTNGFPIQINTNVHGLFIDAAHVNHSCKQNAVHTWNDDIKQLTIHALRDIEAGEEITISYLPKLTKFLYRQTRLKEKYLFECKCELCSLPASEQDYLDSQIGIEESLDGELGPIAWGYFGPEVVLGILFKKMELFTTDDIWDTAILRTYQQAYDTSSEFKNPKDPRARIFAKRAYDMLRLIEGDDSPDTREMKLAAQDITGEPPHFTTKAEFDKWLWMLD